MIDFNSHAQLGTTEEAVHDPMPTSVLQVQLTDTTTTQVPYYTESAFKPSFLLQISQNVLSARSQFPDGWFMIIITCT